MNNNEQEKLVNEIEEINDVLDKTKEETSKNNNEVSEIVETLDDEISQVKKENTVINQIKKIFGYIGYGVLAVLILIVGWMAIQKYVLKDPTPSIFGYSAYYVSTGSMESEIHEGAIIIVKKTNDYKAGEIISFIKDGETVPTTHRIIYVRDGYYVTRGDANDSFDADVYEDEVIGEVVHKFNNFGIFINWIKDGGGFIYVLVVFIIIGAGIYILKQND